MKLSHHSLSALAKVITGDPPQNGKATLAPYRSGPELVTFFNEFRSDAHEYGQGFPSRWAYAEDCLAALNGTTALEAAVNAAFDVRHFTGRSMPIEPAVEFVNAMVDYDGYQIVKAGRQYRIQARSTGVQLDPANLRMQARDPDDEAFIREQLEKCDHKIGSGDYDGAITNARSLVESVLLGLENKLAPADGEYDGDLQKLFKRVQKVMNLEPSRPDVDQSLRQVLGGLASVIYGLAPLRNKMSDAHARSYRPAEHHARLVVNASKTAIDFLVGSYHFQREKGQLP